MQEEETRDQIIKPNLRSKTYMKKRSLIVSRSCGPFLVPRSAYPVQQEIDCSEFQTIKKGMHCIDINLKHLRSLQNFYIGLQGKETDEDFYDIGQTLKKTCSLQHLTLNCLCCPYLTDKAFYYLSPGLKRLSFLKSLNLNFQFDRQITGKGLSSLSQSLRRLVCLEVLKLHFDFCPLIDDFGVSQLSVNLKNLLSLKHLIIEFSPDSDITERGFLDLCNTLERFTCLGSLVLSLPSKENMITDAVLKKLGKALKGLASLRKFNLYLGIHSECTDLGFSKFSEGLEKLVCLRNLTIEVVGFSDQGILHLSRALMRLVDLQTLYINFDCSYDLTDKGVSYISQGFEQLKSLEKLTLKLRDMRRVTDQGFEILSKGLERLVLLQKIEMNLWKFKKITDFGGQSFCNSLKNLPNLKVFDLQVAGCRHFTGTGLFMMCQALKDIPSLQTICFKYEGGETTYLCGKNEFMKALNDPKYFFPNFLDKKEKPDDIENLLQSGIDKREPQPKKGKRKNSKFCACSIF